MRQRPHRKIFARVAASHGFFYQNFSLGHPFANFSHDLLSRLPSQSRRPSFPPSPHDSLRGSSHDLSHFLFDCFSDCLSRLFGGLPLVAFRTACRDFFPNLLSRSSLTTSPCAFLCELPRTVFSGPSQDLLSRPLLRKEILQGKKSSKTSSRLLSGHPLTTSFRDLPCGPPLMSSVSLLGPRLTDMLSQPCFPEFFRASFSRRLLGPPLRPPVTIFRGLLRPPSTTFPADLLLRPPLRTSSQDPYVPSDILSGSPFASLFVGLSHDFLWDIFSRLLSGPLLKTSTITRMATLRASRAPLLCC